MMGDFSAPKKVGKMPTFSKSNKGAAKKKTEDKADEGSEKKDDVEMSEDQPAKPFIDPSDMPLPPKNKDPFADAYPPGQGPPAVDDMPLPPKKKDPMADAYPPG